MQFIFDDSTLVTSGRSVSGARVLGARVFGARVFGARVLGGRVPRVGQRGSLDPGKQVSRAG